MSDNEYEILGVEISATEAEIRRAYFDKARSLHPDVNPNAGEDFARVKQAYEVLKNPSARAQRDLQLGIARPFGTSSLTQEIDVTRLQGTNNQFASKSSQSGFFRGSGYLRRFYSALQFLVPNFKNKRAIPVEEKPLIAEEDGITSFTVGIYSHDSLPIAIGEQIVLSRPGESEDIARCKDVLERSFSRYPVIEKASLIEARFGTKEESAVFLVLLERSVIQGWSRNALQSLSIENYSEDLPGLLLCWSEEGPFSETVHANGIVAYSRAGANALN